MSEIGKVYKVKYPFFKAKYVEYGEDSKTEVDCWTPGCRDGFRQPDEAYSIADSEGEMLLEVISTHKPGKYPERVFYTRKWKDPDGNIFGKTGLHICGTPKFNRLCRGYYYDYELATND